MRASSSTSATTSTASSTRCACATCALRVYRRLVRGFGGGRVGRGSPGGLEPPDQGFVGDAQACRQHPRDVAIDLEADFRLGVDRLVVEPHEYARRQGRHRWRCASRCRPAPFRRSCRSAPAAPAPRRRRGRASSTEASPSMMTYMCVADAAFLDDAACRDRSCISRRATSTSPISAGDRPWKALTRSASLNSRRCRSWKVNCSRTQAHMRVRQLSL